MGVLLTTEGPMDFEQMRIFTVLAEERTFLGAANRLQTSRSRVRRKLDQLEEAAGTRLVSRESSGLTLTAAGEVLLRRGRTLLVDAEHLLAHVRDVGNVPTGRLRIASSLGPPSMASVEACSALQTRYPDLEIEVLFAERPTSLLPERAELALTFEENVGPGHDIIELGEIPMRLFAGPEYIDRHGRPESPEELVLNRLAVWRPDAAPLTQLPLAGGRMLPVAPKVTCEDPAFVHRLARDHDYLAYAPDLVPLRSPSVSTLLVEEVRGAVRERLVIPEVLADLPRVQAFADLCQIAKSTDPASVA
jgi:DNA-binding transcriptional LysR family regulator